MRLTRLLAVGLLAAGLSQLSVVEAEACIKFDRAAEMALIDEGIAAKTTSEPTKAVLRAIRKEIFYFRNKKSLTGEDILQNHWLTTEALKLIRKERIVWTAPEDTPITQVTKSAKRQAVAGAPMQPSCG
jgi:hypothetical protein